MKPTTIVRGGITIIGDPAGNIRIQCRGDGEAACQKADVVDLIAALTEYQRIGPDGEISPAGTFLDV